MAVMPDADKLAPSASRLTSLDAYRGGTMLLMASLGFGAWALLEQPWVAEHPYWEKILLQFRHPEWHGCTLWDLIFPSFLFVIGVAMPHSYAARAGHGQSWFRQALHAFWRGLVIFLLGCFIISYKRNELRIDFPIVLQKIGVCYFLAFLVLRFHWKVLIAIAALLLVGHTAAYLLYPTEGGDPWAIGDNVGHYVQTKWLHLDVFLGNTALAAVTGTVNVIFGILCGLLLQSENSQSRKVKIMLLAGVALCVVGWGLSWWIPINKWLWNSPYTLITGGFTFMMMAVLYWIIDVAGYRRWAFPLVVVGMNSIVVYMVAQLLRDEIQRGLKLFLDRPWFGGKSLTDFPIAYPVVLSVLTLFVIWLFAFWLYRRRVFIKI